MSAGSKTAVTRLALWGSEITEEVLALARNRILDGGNLATRDDLPRRIIKMALIALRELNPREEITMQEQAVLMGVSKNTMTQIVSEKRILHVVNR
jgi:hypothetical protein